MAFQAGSLISVVEWGPDCKWKSVSAMYVMTSVLSSRHYRDKQQSCLCIMASIDICRFVVWRAVQYGRTELQETCELSYLYFLCCY